MKPQLYPALQEYLNKLEPGAIPQERRARLQALIDYIQQCQAQEKPLRLHFICTHNSRRSLLAQVWAHTLAQHFQVPLQAFSGGVEVTAFNPQAVAALRRAGFHIPEPPPGENPPYAVHFAPEAAPMSAYSKLFDAPENPRAPFAAVMTCAEAAQNCPFIPGTERRIALSYEDPKRADGTPQQEATYDARCRQIATELSFVFRQSLFPHA